MGVEVVNLVDIDWKKASLRGYIKIVRYTEVVTSIITVGDVRWNPYLFDYEHQWIYMTELCGICCL